MSVVQPQKVPERRPPPLPPVSAPTNNPFRRGTASPSLSPPIRTDSPAQRPISTNPFLDNPFEMEPPAAQKSMSPPRPPRRYPPPRPGDNEARLSGLSLEDRPPGRMPPPGRSRHHPSNSSGSGPKDTRADTLDIFADPPRRPVERRVRRNSESSVADHKTVDEEERRRRERRHRERQKDSQGRPIPSSRNKKPGRRLDIIDKLDVTSIYGTGMFHHDGPFDALNPHRNRHNSKRAPMQAFPEGSMNNTLGGAGPLNKNIDLNRFHGYQEDSFKDFNSIPASRDAPTQAYEPYIGPDTRPRPASKSGGQMVDGTNGFNPHTKVDPLHGDESLGLGTSTFLEGAPASRMAIERRESENDVIGLTRKKSLAQKIRGISNGRPRRYDNGELASPESRYDGASPEGAPSTGNSNGRPKVHEKNPFFQDYDKEYEKKGNSIRVAEQQKAAESESSRAAGPPLTRSVTEGETGSGNENSVSFSPEPEQKNGNAGGGGFLSRVKSLRGGNKGKSRS